MTLKLLLSLIACLTFNNFNFPGHNEVEARSHDVLPLRAGLIGNIDNGQQEEEAVNPNINDGALVEFPNIKHRKVKTREVQTQRQEVYVAKSQEVTKKRKKKKRKRKKKIAPRRFVKTTVAETDKDSNMTDSKEVVRRKPVDIIVHIKMNE